jgi:glycine dehydrogenase subunit 1
MSLHHYFPQTPEDIAEMLECCGASSLEELYSDVPEELKLHKEYNLPQSFSEKEVRDFFEKLGAKNQRLTCFAGAGYYDHYSPSIIGNLISRSEYLTAYTPYQPEISQGTLQYIFEYQSMMTTLTGLEVSNASMYDGATATAEAMLMAVAAVRRKNRVLISETVNPAVRRVVETYARYHKINLTTIPAVDGVTSFDAVKEALAAGDVAGVIVAVPNYYGIIEDYSGWAEAIHAAKGLLIMNCQASALGVLKTPGEWGADIAVGDGQSLGIPMSFGGPSLGFMCATKALIRKMPGRIVGATTDAKGQRVFVLTLQAREQHIRREKATSNICSNQGLMTLYVSIYLSVMGPKGLKEVNELGCSGAHYLAEKLCATGKMSLLYPEKPYLNEFAVKCNVDVDKLQAKCAEEGILAGVKIDNDTLLLAVTEMQSEEEINRFISIVEKF